MDELDTREGKRVKKDDSKGEQGMVGKERCYTRAHGSSARRGFERGGRGRWEGGRRKTKKKRE